MQIEDSRALGGITYLASQQQPPGGKQTEISSGIISRHLLFGGRMASILPSEG